MTDIFFSYSSKDRERVRPIYEALTGLDFDVFWDQQVPAGTDWDTWIKEKLTRARAAVVFWSASSVASDNVRHEATVAKTQGKLVPVMLDDLRVDQFPMGLFTTQAARLMTWTGSGDDAEWRKLVTELQAKAMPAWVARQLALKDEEITTERKKREAAQARGDAAHMQLEKELAGFDDLRRGREQGLAEAEIARAELSGVKEALDAAKREADDLSGRLAAVERMGTAHRGGVPMWGMVLGLMGALGLGGGSMYVTNSLPLLVSLDKAQTELAAIATAKKEQEDLARRQAEAEAEQARLQEVERQRASEQAALEASRKFQAEAEARAWAQKQESLPVKPWDCSTYSNPESCNSHDECSWSYGIEPRNPVGHPICVSTARAHRY